MTAVWRTGIALAVLGIGYWGAVAAIASAMVSVTAWVALFTVCVVAVAALPRAMPSAPTAAGWLYLALCGALFAAMFYGADRALDILNGAGRPKADVASSLGGLELWFVLCPGAVSVALACAADAALGRARVRG